MAWAGLVLQGVGAVMSANASYQQGLAARKAAEENARLAEMQGAVAEDRLRRDSRREQGTLRARIAKTGARTEGTPLLVLAESEADAELDVLDQRWSTEQVAKSYRTSGSQAYSEGVTRAGTSLLASAGNMF